MRVITLVAIVVGLGACGDNLHPQGDDGDSIDTIAPAQVHAGDVIPIQCNLYQGSGAPTAATDAQVDIHSESSILHLNGQIVARKVGTITVTCSLPDLGLSDPTPATVNIVAGAPYSILTTLSPTQINAGDSVYASCQVFDIEDNPLTDQQPSLAVSPTDPQTAITGLAAQMFRSGHYDGQCTLPGVTGNAVGFDVNPNLAAHLVLGKAPDSPYYPLNTSIGITSTVTDRYGNDVTGATVDLTSHPLTGSGSISASPPSFSYGGEGRYEVDGTVTSPTDGDQPVTASTNIVIDELGPKVLCGTPADASMIVPDPSSTVTFSGTATDVNGTSAVAIDGTPVTLNSDGTFSGPVTSVFGLNFVHVTATDSYGVQATKICTFLASATYENPSSTDAGVIGLSLAQAAVDDHDRTGLPSAIGSLGDLLHVVINSPGLVTTISTELEASNPLTSGCFGGTLFGACIGISYSVDFTGLSFNATNTVSLQLQSGSIASTLSLGDTDLDLHISGFGVDGYLEVSSVTITFTLTPSISGGQPTLTLSSPTVTVGSVSTHFSGSFAGDIIDLISPLLEGTLQSEVQSVLQSFVTSSLGPALNGIFSSLNLGSLGTSLSVPDLFGSGSVKLDLDLAFTSLDATGTRLEFGLGTTFRPDGGYLNSFSTDLGVAVPPGAVLGDPSTSPGDMAVSLNIVLINQALHALWRGNWLTGTFPATTIFAGASPDLSVVMNERLPPVANVLADGTVQLSLGDLDLQLTGGGLPDNFIITIGARAHTTVSISGSTLTFGSLTVDDTELSLDALGLDPSTETELESLVGGLIPTLIGSSLTGALPSFPIPSFSIPSSLDSYGITDGSSLTIGSPALQATAPWLILRGQFSIVH